MTRSPSKDRDAAENPTVGVRMTRFQHDALAARAAALNVSMAKIILSGLADKDEAVAEAHSQSFAKGEAAARRVLNREMGQRDREHREALAEAKESSDAHERAAIAEAELRGRAQADPELRAEAEQARLRAQEWRSGAVTLMRYFEDRGTKLLDWATPSLRPTLSRWLDAQEATIRAEFGRQADQLPLPRQVAAEIAAAEKQAITLAVSETRRKLLPQIAAAEVALAKAGHQLDALRAELATAQEKLVETQTELTDARLEAAQIPALHAQVRELTQQLQAALRSPLQQFAAQHQQRMKQLAAEREQRQREWDERRDAERERRRAQWKATFTHQ